MKDLFSYNSRPGSVFSLTSPDLKALQIMKFMYTYVFAWRSYLLLVLLRILMHCELYSLKISPGNNLFLMPFPTLFINQT